MGRIFAVILSICLMQSVCWAEEHAMPGGQRPKDEKFRESYSLGYEFGSNVKNQQLVVDIDVLLSAARDALEGKPSALTPEEKQNALKDLRRKVLVAQDLRNRKRLTDNLEEGRKFLEANKTKEGVKTLPSGLQYMVLSEGSGPGPKADDMVKVHYRGTLINGNEFDSSYSHGGEPMIIRADSMMRGWTEALQLMKVGAKWKIFVPTELAYGVRQFGRIPPNSALIFELELLDAGKDLIPRVPAPDLPEDEESQGPADKPEK